MLHKIVERYSDSKPQSAEIFLQLPYAGNRTTEQSTSLPSYMYLTRTLTTRWFDGLSLLQVLAKGKNVMKRKWMYTIAEATRLERRLDYCICIW